MQWLARPLLMTFIALLLAWFVVAQSPPARAGLLGVVANATDPVYEFQDAFSICVMRGLSQANGCPAMPRAVASQCLLEAESAAYGIPLLPLRAMAPRIPSVLPVVAASNSFTAAGMQPLNWSLPVLAVADATISQDLFGAQSQHAYVLPASAMGDMVDVAGFPQDMSALTADDKDLDWPGFLPLYRDVLAVYNSKVMAIPLTGVMQLLYYRRDVFAAAGLPPPRTWAEMLAAAARFNGTDLDGDGKANDWGLCIWQARDCEQASTPIVTVLASLVQSGGRHGGLYFNPETMEAAINTVAFEVAMSTVRNLSRYAPPPLPTNPDPAADCFTMTSFATGKCAMALSMAGLFKYSSYIANNKSIVRGKVGVLPSPGSPVVLDWAQKALVPCDYQRCPFAVEYAKPENLAVYLNPAPGAAAGSASNGSGSGNSNASAGASAANKGTRRALLQQDGQSPSSNSTSQAKFLVNVAPFMSTGGLSLFLNKKFSEQQRAAMYSVIVHIIRETGGWNTVISPRASVGPTRTEHLDPTQEYRWLQAGYHPEDTRQFLAATRTSVASGNTASDIRSRSARAYHRVFFISAQLINNNSLPLPFVIGALRKTFNDTYPPALVASTAASYRASIRYIDIPPPPPPPADSAAREVAAQAEEHNVLGVALGVSLAGALLLVLAVAGLTWQLKRRRLPLHLGRITAPGVGPGTTLVITDIQDSTRLWESLATAVMDRSIQMHHTCLRRCTTACGGYESATEGDSFILAFHSPQTALLFCLTAQDELPCLDWPEALLQADSCRPIWIRDAPQGSQIAVRTASQVTVSQLVDPAWVTASVSAVADNPPTIAPPNACPQGAAAADSKEPSTPAIAAAVDASDLSPRAENRRRIVARSFAAVRRSGARLVSFAVGNRSTFGSPAGGTAGGPLMHFSMQHAHVPTSDVHSVPAEGDTERSRPHSRVRMAMLDPSISGGAAHISRSMASADFDTVSLRTVAVGLLLSPGTGTPPLVSGTVGDRGTTGGGYTQDSMLEENNDDQGPGVSTGSFLGGTTQDLQQPMTPNSMTHEVDGSGQEMQTPTLRTPEGSATNIPSLAVAGVGDAGSLQDGQARVMPAFRRLLSTWKRPKSGLALSLGAGGKQSGLRSSQKQLPGFTGNTTIIQLLRDRFTFVEGSRMLAAAAAVQQEPSTAGGRGAATPVTTDIDEHDTPLPQAATTGMGMSSPAAGTRGAVLELEIGPSSRHSLEAAPPMPAALRTNQASSPWLLLDKFRTRSRNALQRQQSESSCLADGPDAVQASGTSGAVPDGVVNEPSVSQPRTGRHQQHPMMLAGPRLLLAGLRVRMGMSSGVRLEADITFNRSMQRTHYTGIPMATAKAVAGAASGAMVLVSSDAHALLTSGVDPTSSHVPIQGLSSSGAGYAAGTQRAVFWHGGVHVLDEHLSPLEIYLAATPGQVPRWATLVAPAAADKFPTLAPSALDTPVGQLAVAAVTVSGANHIAASNVGVWRQSAALLWREAARLATELGGFLASTRAATIHQGMEPAASTAAAGGMGGQTVLLMAAFTSAASAVRWATQLLEFGLLAPWPAALLLSELAEEIWREELAIASMDLRGNGNSITPTAGRHGSGPSGPLALMARTSTALMGRRSATGADLSGTLQQVSCKGAGRSQRGTGQGARDVSMPNLQLPDGLPFLTDTSLNGRVSSIVGMAQHDSKDVPQSLSRAGSSGRAAALVSPMPPGSATSQRRARLARLGTAHSASRKTLTPDGGGNSGSGGGGGGGSSYSRLTSEGMCLAVPASAILMAEELGPGHSQADDNGGQAGFTLPDPGMEGPARPLSNSRVMGTLGGGGTGSGGAGTGSSTGTNSTAGTGGCSTPQRAPGVMSHQRRSSRGWSTALLAGVGEPGPPSHGGPGSVDIYSRGPGRVHLSRTFSGSSSHLVDTVTGLPLSPLVLQTVAETAAVGSVGTATLSSAAMQLQGSGSIHGHRAIKPIVATPPGGAGVQQSLSGGTDAATSGTILSATTIGSQRASMHSSTAGFSNHGSSRGHGTQSHASTTSAGSNPIALSAMARLRPPTAIEVSPSVIPEALAHHLLASGAGPIFAVGQGRGRDLSSRVEGSSLGNNSGHYGQIRPRGGRVSVEPRHNNMLQTGLSFTSGSRLRLGSGDDGGRHHGNPPPRVQSGPTAEFVRAALSTGGSGPVTDTDGDPAQPKTTVSGTITASTTARVGSTPVLPLQRQQGSHKPSMTVVTPANLTTAAQRTFLASFTNEHSGDCDEHGVPYSDRDREHSYTYNHHDFGGGTDYDDALRSVGSIPRGELGRLPEEMLHFFLCRGLRLRCGIEYGVVSADVNCVNGAVQYSGPAAVGAVSLAMSAPVSQVLVSSGAASAAAEAVMAEVTLMAEVAVATAAAFASPSSVLCNEIQQGDLTPQPPPPTKQQGTQASSARPHAVLWKQGRVQIQGRPR